MAYEGAERGERGLNWVTSPVESWEMSDHNQKLDREDFERHVKIHTDHWERTNASAKAEGTDREDSTSEKDSDSEQAPEESSGPGAKDDSASGSDADSDSDGNIIDNYAESYQEKQKRKNDTSADNMDLNQQIKSSSTAGDQQIYDAKIQSPRRDATRF